MELLTALLIISVAGNAFLGFRLKEKLKKQPTFDASELLRYLARGEALVVVRCVDPENVFLRSVRA